MRAQQALFSNSHCHFVCRGEGGVKKDRKLRAHLMYGNLPQECPQRIIQQKGQAKQ